MSNNAIAGWWVIVGVVAITTGIWLAWGATAALIGLGLFMIWGGAMAYKQEGGDK